MDNNCMYPGVMKYTSSEVRLMNEFRMLWEQHDVWTRSTIMSIAFGLPDINSVTNRLLRNPVDFASVFEVYYGPNFASTFCSLLRTHLTLAAQLVQASKAGNSQAAAEVERSWYQNADEIAAALASVNPFWSEQQWRMMLHEHLRLVKAEAVYILNGDYSASIAVYDVNERKTLEMADVMSRGIIKQFL